MISVPISLSVSDGPSIIEALALRLERLHANGATGTLMVDLSQVSFVRADGVLALLSCARVWYGWTGERTILVNIPQAVHAYLERADLFATPWLRAETELALSASYRRSSQSHTLCELTSISSEPEQNARDVPQALLAAQRIITSWFTAAPSSVDRLLTILAELAENVTHSGDLGHVIIQRYHDASHEASHNAPRSRVMLAIADLGIGIEGSLRRNPAIVRQRLRQGSAYIAAALQRGVTSRAGVGGAGLARIQDIVTEWRGELYIRSQSSSLFLSPHGRTARDHLAPMPGAHITFTTRGVRRDDGLGA